jgi:hypothetical protein
MTLTADEFIRRFLIHVLPSGFQRIRCRVGGGALSDLGADLRPPLKLDVQFSRIQLSWMALRSLK